LVRRNWRLLLGAATLLTGAVTVSHVEPTTAASDCVPSPSGEAELNQWFASPGLGAVSGQEGYGGGDYPHAYALPDGRVLWLLQDLHFSNDETLGATDAGPRPRPTSSSTSSASGPEIFPSCLRQTIRGAV
jgi:hypothetical protein